MQHCLSGNVSTERSTLQHCLSGNVSRERSTLHTVCKAIKTYHVRLEVGHMVSNILGGHVKLVGRLGEEGEVEVENSRPGGKDTTTHHNHHCAHTD